MPIRSDSLFCHSKKLFETFCFQEIKVIVIVLFFYTHQNSKIEIHERGEKVQNEFQNYDYLMPFYCFLSTKNSKSIAEHLVLYCNDSLEKA